MGPLLFFTLLTPLLLFFITQIGIILGRTMKNSVLEFYARSVASFVALILCATYGTIASALLNIAGYGGLGQWTTARSFKWMMWYFTGVWFDIQDEGPKEGPPGEGGWLGGTRPAVFVGNHQTEMDVLVLGHIFPKYCSVTSKKSLMYLPFLGWFMAMSKTVFIERKSRSQAVAAFDKAAEQMHLNRQSVFIFPEGTRSYYDHPDLLPFKKGAFHLAVQAQVPIVPVVVANYSNVLNIKKKIFRSGSIPISVLEPIPTKGKTKEDVDALLEEVRQLMLRELEILTKRARQEGIAMAAPQSGTANGKARSTGVDVAVNAAA